MPATYSDSQGLHTAEHELTFIKKLGSFGTEIPYEKRLTRDQLLMNYHKALKKREVWGLIDKDKVTGELFRLIYCKDFPNKK